MTVWEQFCANKPLKQTFGHILESGRLFHAYLLEGENGLGKKTFAKYMAASFLCEQNHQNGTDRNIPCGRCESCYKVLHDIHPDVQVWGGGGSRSFHVEDIRSIRSGLYIRPNEGDYRIYILANAEDMTPQAQNALLKSLEEPPAHTIFILTSENKTLLLPTVLSRLLCLRVEAPELSACVEYICKLNPQYSSSQVKEAALLYNCNIGKTLQSLSDPSYQKVLDSCKALTEAICKRDSGQLLKVTASFEKDKPFFKSTVMTLQNAFHKAMITKYTGDALSHPLLGTLQTSLSSAKLMQLEALCQQTLHYILGNANHTLLLSWFTSQLQYI